MKNSYGIYNSEAERIDAKIHTIKDIIESQKWSCIYKQLRKSS